MVKRRKKKERKSTMTSGMEPPMPQVLVFYIRNEGERNQKTTRRNKLKKTSSMTSKLEPLVPQVLVC
jgi:hypothetical protein